MTAQEFVDQLNAKFGGTFELGDNGKKFTRIIDHSGGGRSAYCFIDNNGNILKAASWKTPAKGVRSTLESVDINKVDQYGSWLYSR